MIRLLFPLVFSEMTVILVLIFKNPLRKVFIWCLDRVKRGQGPIVIKTVAATLLIMLGSSLYSLLKIPGPLEEGDGIPILMSPTDQILFAKHLLEATLTGSSLFLALMIDRLHHYIRELRMRRKSMEAAKKQTETNEERKAQENKALSGEITELKGESRELRMRILTLEEEVKAKSKEIHSYEANAEALRKQSEGFLMEYDRLHEENQNLRSQLQSLDSKWSRSDTKKVP